MSEFISSIELNCSTYLIPFLQTVCFRVHTVVCLVTGAAWMWLPTGLCRLCAGSLTLWGNDNEGNKLNSTKTFAVWEIEKWDRFYSKWEVQGRSWGCRIWIGVCVYVCLCMCALKGCFYEGKGWELSVWPSRCVRRWLLGLVRPSAEVATWQW